MDGLVGALTGLVVFLFFIYVPRLLFSMVRNYRIINSDLPEKCICGAHSADIERIAVEGTGVYTACTQCGHISEKHDAVVARVIRELLESNKRESSADPAEEAEMVNPAKAPAAKLNLSEIACNLLEAHSDREDDVVAVAVAKQIALNSALDDGQAYWELTHLRFFWLRTAVLGGITNPNPLIDQLHFYFLEGMRLALSIPTQDMARYEEQLNIRMMTYRAAYNDTPGSKGSRIFAVSKSFIEKLGLPESIAVEISGFLDKQAFTTLDVVPTKLRFRGLI